MRWSRTTTASSAPCRSPGLNQEDGGTRRGCLPQPEGVAWTCFGPVVVTRTEARKERQDAKAPRCEGERGRSECAGASWVGRSRSAMDASPRRRDRPCEVPAPRTAGGPDRRSGWTREHLSLPPAPPVRGGCWRQPPGSARTLPSLGDGLASWRLGVSISGSRADRNGHRLRTGADLTGCHGRCSSVDTLVIPPCPLAPAAVSLCFLCASVALPLSGRPLQ